MALLLDGVAHEAYAINASPALCVAHAVLELAPRKPDLCLSGINYGENIGYSFTASGTIGACLEAQAFGIPSLAASLETPIHLNHTKEYEPMDWRVTKHFARVLAERILQRGLPSGVGLLNLNVPLRCHRANRLALDTTKRTKLLCVVECRPNSRPRPTVKTSIRQTFRYGDIRAGQRHSRDSSRSGSKCDTDLTQHYCASAFRRLVAICQCR